MGGLPPGAILFSPVEPRAAWGSPDSPRLLFSSVTGAVVVGSRGLRLTSTLRWAGVAAVVVLVVEAAAAGAAAGVGAVRTRTGLLAAGSARRTNWP